MDANGVEWTIFEVQRNSSRTRWEYLPAGFEDGWLCFESRYGKRRLTPVPPRWRDADAEQLRQLLARAQSVLEPRPRGEDRPNAD